MSAAIHWSGPGARGWRSRTRHGDLLPRPAAVVLLRATAGFFVVSFVSEFLPAPAGQMKTAVFGILLALGFAWVGVALWLRT